MAKLSRYTAKLFGSGAGANQMAEFGSLAAAAPQLYSGSTITPTIVQTLSNYVSGWFAAVIGANSPAIEDMNALCFLFSFGIAYQFQAGVAEWDSGTTYYTNSMVNFNGVIYVSLVDNNTNHTPPNGSFWGPLLNSALISPASLFQSTVVPTGNTMNWDNATIPAGQTLTIQTGSYLISKNPFGPFTALGTLTLQGTAQAQIYT